MSADEVRIAQEHGFAVSPYTRTMNDPLVFEATIGWTTDDTTFETIEPIPPDGQWSPDGVLELVTKHYGIDCDDDRAMDGQLEGRYRITIERLEASELEGESAA